MKVFCLGVDQLTSSYLKENGIHVIDQSDLPDSNYLDDNILVVTSEYVKPEQFKEVRERYSSATLIYWHLENGIRNNQMVTTQCSMHDIHALTSRSTADTLLDKLQTILDLSIERKSNLIGFYGTAPGVGCTSLASTYARRFASQGFKTILLGLDLFDPSFNKKPTVSLDQWRPKITGKILLNDDFDNLLIQDGYRCLPGNFDYFAAEDFSEVEIEYLLDRAQENADVVIADFGSIAHSAAWYVGMQRANIRCMVSFTDHLYRLKAQLELLDHLNIRNTDMYLIVNQSNLGDVNTPKDLSIETGIGLLHEITSFDGFIGHDLPLGKKDTILIDEKIQHFLVGMGLRDLPSKRRILG